MKTVLFTNVVKELKVGDLVVGPSAKEEKFIAELSELSKESVRDEFKKRHMPLYEVVSIVNRRFLLYRRHYAKIRRFADGKILEINLDPPASDFFARTAPIDMRLDWARLEFSQ